MVYFESIVIASFLLIVVFLGVDISDDLSHGADLSHVVWEAGALFISSGLLTGYLLKFARQVWEEQQSTAGALQGVTADRDKWREQSESYLRGLGKAIDEQFHSWGLSESEKEIGLLMLKGFSHKEIAGIRQTSERTVRQQAAALYSKAGLENKAQLAAFFLEGLILPKEPAQK